MTEIVKPICSPALTVALSAVLVALRSGQFTVIDTGPDELLFALESASAETPAVFSMPGQVSALVVPVRVTCFSSPGCIVPKWQVSTADATAQSPASAPLGASQATLAGRVSVSVTLVESPLPPAVTVMS